jgi:outer membrane protein assembly factor BamA
MVAFALSLAISAGFGTTFAGEAPADSSGEEDFTHLSGFPIVFYTPETGLAAGAAGAYFYKQEATQRPNSIGGILFFTAKSQIVFGLTSEIYSRDGSRRIEGGLGFQKFPTSFWGIGNDTTDDMEETYTPRTVEVSLEFQRRLLSHFMLGGTYRFWYEDVTEVEQGGLLDSADIPGSEGGISSGLGFVATWDTRDKVHYTKRGAYLDLGATYHGSFLGSDYEYSRFNLDLRYFIPVYGANALGLRGLLRASAGDTPFQAMPGIGGALLLRGYPEGRYRDMAAASLQAELRSDYVWLFGFAVFGSLGKVAESVGSLSDTAFRYTAGAGVRVRLNDENFNLRIDFGAGDNTNGFYIVAGEAF